ncbi:TonB-dependent siderophore receptor [Gloeocapsa sp. PCC 7428]|uniref:TonB-dependent siderophore receptor n=1 Tax=Gloeocapsa sp. PCC 7428 TaxID=1173026 RepID=UPI0002A5E24C|nr:TonB-dependent siderophore receptor [Gloeocapsa sp. PCC 7428]AFZ31359.1 TonB-dependent siderophore receptor [Gloeocapsa sp. PCC 7428]
MRSIVFRLSWGVGLWLVAVGLMSPAAAQTERVVDVEASRTEIKQPARTIAEWQAQIVRSLVEITAVRVYQTETGLEVVLQTTGELATPTTTVTGNTLIVDISNAVLLEEFSAAEPTAGIALVTVTMPGERVQVAITGTDAPPVAEVQPDVQGLVLSVSPDTENISVEEDEIQIVVTGEQDEGYNPSSASVGTRTDTPLRDIPQSIQVVPQEVIRDQNANRLGEILENVPGITGSFRSPRSVSNFFNSRGFELEVLRNGSPDTLGADYSYTVSDNIERVEVLKGPASVLFGLGTLGGAANIITKKPLREPFYSIEATVGSFNTYRGSIDLSGPLDESTDDNITVLYRLNASANTTGSFIDFFERQTYLVAPSLTWQIGEQTRLTFDAEYQRITGTKTDYGLPAEGSVLPNPNGEIPRNRYRGEPSLENDDDTDLYRIGYDLEYRFSENWQVRSSLQTVFWKENVRVNVPLSFLDNKREQPRLYIQSDNFLESYQLDNYVAGEFSTGSIQHQLVAGFNLYREDLRYTDGIEGILPAIDVFNPVYGAITLADLSDPIPDQDARFLTQGLGLYLQDQMTLAENLKVLLGGRFDIVEQEAAFVPFFQRASQQEQAFSPRIGIVYQPIEPIALYASYSRSFSPAQGRAVDISSQFKPERGTQYEIGVKADITDRLSATLALFNLTRTNVVTTDPNNPLLSIQTGEQRSQGVELDLSGEILPGWNIFAGFALIDAEITEDNTLPVGNQLNNTPRTSFNLWTTYELQSGSLQGLGFGLGVFYAGERQGDLDNSFQLPSYVRTDAAIFYTRNNFRAALNLKNLFDVEYFASANGRNNVYLGDPFTVQGTLSWEF